MQSANHSPALAESSPQWKRESTFTSAAGEYTETRSVWSDACVNHTLNTKNKHSAAATRPTETQTPDASSTPVPMAEEADFMRSVLPVHGAFPSSEDSSLALPQEDKLALADTHRLNRLQQQVQLTLSRKRKKPNPPGMWNETAWNKSKYVKRSSVLVWNRIQVYTFLHFWKKYEMSVKC